MTLTALNRATLVHLLEPIQAAERVIALTEVRDKRAAELTAAQSRQSTIGALLAAKITAGQAVVTARHAVPFVKATYDAALNAYITDWDGDPERFGDYQYDPTFGIAETIAGLAAGVTPAQHDYDAAVAALTAETTRQTAMAAELAAG